MRGRFPCIDCGQRMDAEYREIIANVAKGTVCRLLQVPQCRGRALFLVEMIRLREQAIRNMEIDTVAANQSVIAAGVFAGRCKG